jgi:hypothetical protein
MMTKNAHKDVTTVVEQLLCTPMVQWEAIIDGLTPAERREASEHAIDMATRATRLGAYLDTRESQAHTVAVERQNRVVTALRKALGYTYPDSGVQF